LSDITKDAIETILKHLTDRIALAVLFLCVISLAVMLTAGEVGDWMRAHWLWIFFGLPGSLCYLPTRFVLDKVAETLTENKRHERLDDLTRREKEFLAPYIQNDYRARRVLHTDPVAKGLRDDGVLSAPDVALDQSKMKAYNIQNWARSYLKKHPDILRDVSNTQNPGTHKFLSDIEFQRPCSLRQIRST
jgi:hypothetical protein